MKFYLNLSAIGIAKARQNINDRELAKRSGLSTTSIATILKKGKAKDTTAGKLAEALGVDVSEIVTP